MAGDKDNSFFFSSSCYRGPQKLRSKDKLQEQFLIEREICQHLSSRSSAKGGPGSENKARPQTKGCGLRSANRCTCQWPGLLCAAPSEGSRPRLHAVQNRTLPACWDLIWKGPRSAGDLTWLFPKPAPASFLGTFLSGSRPNKWIYQPRG